MISSYSKVHALGHKEIADILDSPVVIQEKVDGSQFSFGVIDGKLMCRSKGQHLIVDAPEKMFALGVETAKRLAPILKPGWVYRGEYLQKPKHNTLTYSRVPKDNVILFDVMTAPETYLCPVAADLKNEVARLGLESVPVYSGGIIKVGDLATLDQFLSRESILGGRIEGVVIKNYSKFTPDGKLATAKWVSSDFKEKHRGEWKVSNPSSGDFVEALAQSLRTPARWRKAVQHLAEAGQLVNAPEDIGKLITELKTDTRAEEAEQVKQALFDHFWPHIERRVAAGFPEFYKTEVLGMPSVQRKIA